MRSSREAPAAGSLAAGIAAARLVPRLVAVAAVLSTALVSLGSTPALAADQISLPSDTIIDGVPGSLIELGRVPVDTDIAGPLCTWTASATNQHSVHLGNDILIQSGDSELVLSSVEDVPGKVTTNTGSAYLADEVVAVLRMGDDGIFSGGLQLTITYELCQAVPTTVPSTTAPPTTAPPTTAPATTGAPTVPTSSGTSSTSVTVTVELEPLGPTVTSGPTTTVEAPTSPTTVSSGAGALPVTGSSLTVSFVLLGLILLSAGGVMISWGREHS